GPIDGSLEERLDCIGGLLVGVPVDDVAAGNRDHLEAVADLPYVILELLLAHQPELLRMHEQRRRGEDRRRRRVGAELAVGGDDSRAAEAPAEPSVGRGLEVLARLLLQALPR